MIIQHDLLVASTVDFHPGGISPKVTSNWIRIDVLAIVNVTKYNAPHRITQYLVVFRIPLEHFVRSGVVVRKIESGRTENLFTSEERFPIERVVLTADSAEGLLVVDVTGYFCILSAMSNEDDSLPKLKIIIILFSNTIR